MLWLETTKIKRMKGEMHKHLACTLWRSSHHRKPIRIHAMDHFVSPCILLSLFSILNVIRAYYIWTKGMCQQLKSFSLLVTAAAWGYLWWPHTRKVTIKWPSPSNNLFKELICMLSGNWADGSISHIWVFCHIWKFVLCSSLDSAFISIRYPHKQSSRTPERSAHNFALRKQSILKKFVESYEWDQSVTLFCW